MAHTLIDIATIQSITPIEGADNIVKAKVNNYDVVVRKDEFKEGDKVIYCYYDTILPIKDEFKFLESCYSKKYNGYVIKPRKIRKVISEGLVLPISILPNNEKYNIGDDISDVLKAKSRGDFELGEEKATETGKYPMWITKSNEENIEKIYEEIIEDEKKKSNLKREYIITEKLEGMATTYSYVNGEFKVYSHSRLVNSGIWYVWAIQNNIEEKLKEYTEKRGLQGIAIQGEIIGENIQNNIYDIKGNKFYLYGGYSLNGEPLSWKQLKEISTECKIAIVPYLKSIHRVSIYSLEQLLKLSEDISVLNPQVPREGIVLRTTDGKIHFKVKSRPYKIWFEKIGEK